MVGYGITQSGSIPTSLQTAQMAVVSNSDCQSIMSSALGGGTYIDDSIRSGRSGRRSPLYSITS